MQHVYLVTCEIEPCPLCRPDFISSGWQAAFPLDAELIRGQHRDPVMTITTTKCTGKVSVHTEPLSQLPRLVQRAGTLLAHI
jgi:hypothetical protein